MSSLTISYGSILKRSFALALIESNITISGSVGRVTSVEIKELRGDRHSGFDSLILELSGSGFSHLLEIKLDST